MASAKKTETAAPAAFVPKVKKLLTLPLLKIKADETVYVQIKGAMYLAKAQPPKDGKPAETPPTLATAVNLETGELCQIICGEVMKSTLAENYPDNEYIDKGFSVTMHPAKNGKKYNTYTISEIEV